MNYMLNNIISVFVNFLFASLDFFRYTMRNENENSFISHDFDAKYIIFKSIKQIVF